MKINFNVNDIIRFNGKSINSFTKGKEYVIHKKESRTNWVIKYDVVYLFDNNNREKHIILNNNKWREKFSYVSNVRKEKLKKINNIND